MSFRSKVLAGAIATAFLVPLAAEAAPGFATGSVNLRSGPGTQYARITTIPAGARIDVRDCGAWCAVSFNGVSGYVSANYVSRGVATVGPRFVRPPAPRFGYARKPWWDNRYHAWYDGRRWYSNGRWYDRPGFSLNFNFGG
jgi:uncharacterized protein YraI